MSDELTTDQVREIAQDVLSQWLGGYHYIDPLALMPQIQLRRMADGSWRADPADGARAQGTLGTFRVAVTVERVDTPEYCAKCDHAAHHCSGCGVDVPHGRIACEKCR